MACCCYIQRRYIIVVMACLGMIIIHAQRVNLSVTAILMFDEAPHEKVGSMEAILNMPANNWSPKLIGLLHSIFYTGYMITQIPGGFLSQHLPCHRIFGGCILLSCSLNLLLPIAINRIGFVFTSIVRFLQGFSEGVLFPSCYALLRHWSPPEEKSRMGSIVLTGVYSGAIVGLPISGFVTHYFGWSYAYYVHGAFGIIWFIFWLFLGYEKPSHHPYISKDELKFIEQRQGDNALVMEHESVPWKEIFLSIPVNALNVCNFARSFIFFLLLTNEAEYMNAFNFTVAENGLFSAFPHVGMVLFSSISGLIADHLMNGGMLNATQVRKLFTCIGFGMEGTCLFMLYFIEDGTQALIFLTLGVGFSGLTISGWNINHLDLAPRYASVLIGITTAFGTIAGIINPSVIAAMTPHQTVKEWQNVFLLTSMILLFAAVTYCLFGSGVQQPWANPVDAVRINTKEEDLVTKSGGISTAICNQTSIDNEETMPIAVPISGTNSKINSSSSTSGIGDNVNGKSPLITNYGSNNNNNNNMGEIQPKTE